MNALEIQKVLDISKEADGIQLYYSIYLYIMLFISIPSIIIILINQDLFMHVNSEFRPILFHIIGTSFILMTNLFAWQPLVYPPFIGGCSIGIFGWLLGSDGFLFGFWSTWVCIGHLGASFASAFLLQSYQLKVANI